MSDCANHQGPGCYLCAEDRLHPSTIGPIPSTEGACQLAREAALVAEKEAAFVALDKIHGICHILLGPAGQAAADEAFAEMAGFIAWRDRLSEGLRHAHGVLLDELKQSWAESSLIVADKDGNGVIELCGEAFDALPEPLKVRHLAWKLPKLIAFRYANPGRPDEDLKLWLTIPGYGWTAGPGEKGAILLPDPFDIAQVIRTDADNNDSKALKWLNEGFIAYGGDNSAKVLMGGEWDAWHAIAEALFPLLVDKGVIREGCMGCGLEWIAEGPSSRSGPKPSRCPDCAKEHRNEQSRRRTRTIRNGSAG